MAKTGRGSGGDRKRKWWGQEEEVVKYRKME